jgi:predicted nucleotide-binding protein
MVAAAQTSESSGPLRARVFVASSREAGLVATAVQTVLTETARVHYGELDIEVRVWTHTFVIGSSPLRSLISATETYNFGVFVFSADDRVESRDEIEMAPRDNVVYELGLFTGALGTDRVFIMAPDAVKMPSDVQAVLPARYEVPSKPRDPRALRSNVGGACHDILDVIETTLVELAETQDVARSSGAAPSHGEAQLMSELLVDLRRGELPRVGGAGDELEGRGIIHPRYGLGIVISVARDGGNDVLVTAQFEFGAVTVPAKELFFTTRGP